MNLATLAEKLYNTINETQYINTKVKEDETINEYFGDKKHLLKVGDEIKEMLDLKYTAHPKAK